MCTIGKDDEVNLVVVCGTNTGELVVFDSSKSFRAQKYDLGKFSIKKISGTETNVVVLCNNNILRVYFNGNYSMALTCKDMVSDPITEVLSINTSSSTQVILFFIFIIHMMIILYLPMFLYIRFFSPLLQNYSFYLSMNQVCHPN